VKQWMLNDNDFDNAFDKLKTPIDQVIAMFSVQYHGIYQAHLKKLTI
jgi:hypothetical protein